jgi:thiamine biosynthesis lipoprotein
MKVLEFKALGTIWCIESNRLSKDLENNILRIVKDFEDNYSRFKLESVLNQLNVNKFYLNPPPEMLKMLSFAISMYSRTQHIFNISIGGDLSKRGYGLNSLSGEISSNLLDDIIVTENSITINQNISLDLGGFGKGWLVDKLANFLKQSCCDQITVNGGGDIRVISNSPIDILLEAPLSSGDSLEPTIVGSTKITNGGLAVSSNFYRSWKDQNGQIQTHIQTNNKNNSKTYFVKASTCLIADLIATCMVAEPSLKNYYLQEFKDYDLKIISN